MITDANRPQVGDDLQINAIGAENDVNFGTKNGVNTPITNSLKTTPDTDGKMPDSLKTCRIRKEDNTTWIQTK